MEPNNPYQPPTTPVDQGVQATAATAQTASGQKLVIYAILLYMLGAALRVAIGEAGAVIALVAFVLSFVGIVRLASGLGMSTATKILLVVLMFVPLVNWITLLVINSKATSALRAAGYKVGLMGASK